MTEIPIAKPILALNDRFAAANRELLDSHGIFMLDLIASPGAGKTSTILATIDALRDTYSIAVIEGDIASDIDSRKIKEQGIPAVQINTGGICHLEARMVSQALEVLDLASLDLIIVENVGNLVCPTDFYLGEDCKVVILSVLEGHDKPPKYPGVFQVAQAVILNKIDTMPVFDFDERQFRVDVEHINPRALIFPISTTKGRGIKTWAQWLAAQIEVSRRKQGRSLHATDNH